jgi:hypothetical protein
MQPSCPPSVLANCNKRPVSAIPEGAVFLPSSAVGTGPSAPRFAVFSSVGITYLPFRPRVGASRPPQPHR